MNRLAPLLPKNIIEEIHTRSLQLLEKVGVIFASLKARKILQKGGAITKENSELVRFPPELIDHHLRLCPSEFVVKARSPDKSIRIGRSCPVLAPGYGAPFIFELNQGRRRGKIEDLINFIKLTHLSGELDCSGGIIVEPQDIPATTRHLDIVKALIVYSDKPFMGAVAGKEAALDTLEMASFIWGGESELKRNPGVLALINTQSPLLYDPKTLEALLEYTSFGQPVIIAPLISAGVSGPVTLLGTIIQHNAEVLSGVVLAQMIREGSPVIYGAASTCADMRTGGAAIGAPESSILTSVFSQMASFYNLPSRGGGALTDSKIPDAQSGYEKMMSLMNTFISGIDFVLHSAGILDSYLTMSYEQFIMDIEMIKIIKRFLSGVNISPEKFAVDVIKKVGPGGHFLDTDHTSKYFKEELFLPRLSNRETYQIWESQGCQDTFARANQLYKEILEEYQQPKIEANLQEKVEEFVEMRKKSYRIP